MLSIEFNPVLCAGAGWARCRRVFQALSCSPLAPWLLFEIPSGSPRNAAPFVVVGATSGVIGLPVGTMGAFRGIGFATPPSSALFSEFCCKTTEG